MNEDQLNHWAIQLLTARKASGTTGSFSDYADLVEMAKGGGLEEAKILLSTLTEDPEDNGEGERALSVLSGFPPHIRAAAIVSQAPSLVARGEVEWADSVIETASRFYPAYLVDGIKSADLSTRDLFCRLIKELSRKESLREPDTVFAPILIALSYCDNGDNDCFVEEYWTS